MNQIEQKKGPAETGLSNEEDNYTLQGNGSEVKDFSVLRPLQISAHTKVQHKAIAHGFRVENLTEENSKSLLTRDYCPSIFDQGHKTIKNWQSSDFIPGDVDGGLTLEQFMGVFAEYNFIIQTSRNHQKVKTKNSITFPACNRFHVMFIRERTETDPDRQLGQIQALIKDHSFFDPQYNTIEMQFYGDPDSQIIWNLGGSFFDIEPIVFKSQKQAAPQISGRDPIPPTTRHRHFGTLIGNLYNLNLSRDQILIACKTENEERCADHDFADIEGWVNSAFKNWDKQIPSQLVHGNKAEIKRSFLKRSEMILNDPEWLLENYITKQTLAFILGVPEGLKTFFAIAWALHVATGLKWQGNDVLQGNVFYIAGEGQAGIIRRIAAWESAFYDKKQVENFNFRNVPIDLFNPATVTALCAEFDSYIDEKPDLIIIDTLSRNFSGNENSSDMALAVAELTKLQNRYGCTMLIVHHVGLSTMAKERGRGHSSLHGGADWEYLVERESPDSYNCTLKCTKVKDFERPKPMAFVMEEIMLGHRDKKGFPLHSLVPRRTEYMPIVKQKVIPDSRKEIIVALADFPDGCGPSAIHLKLPHQKFDTIKKSMKSLGDQGHIHVLGAGMYKSKGNLE